MNEFLQSNWVAILLGALVVANAVVRFTKTKKDDIIFDFVLKIIFKRVPGLKGIDLSPRRPA